MPLALNCTRSRTSDKAVVLTIPDTFLTPLATDRGIMYNQASLPHCKEEFETHHRGGLVTYEAMAEICDIRGVERVFLRRKRLEIHVKSGSLTKVARKAHEALAKLFDEGLDLNIEDLAA